MTRPVEPGPPGEVTEAMRQAVYTADCALLGHQFDGTHLFGASDGPNPNDPRGMPMVVLRARDPSKLPHLTCTRCGHVWLLIDTEGVDYDDAVTKATTRVAGAPKVLTPRPRPGVDGRPIPVGSAGDRTPDHLKPQPVPPPERPRR